MKKILAAAWLFLATASLECAVVKDASEVFKRWIQIQQLMPDCVFSDLTSSINESFVQDFRVSYEMQLQLLNKQHAFLNALTGGCITQYGYQIGWPMTVQFNKNITSFYALADTDVAGALKFLEALNLFEVEGDRVNTDGLVDQFNGVTQLLFSGQSEIKKNELMFNLANRYAEWLFGQSFPIVGQRMMVDKSYHQILRYLYAVIWQRLAGHGWKNWHRSSLNNLAQESTQGKTVVYIAGGSDIFQLIRSGVYNIVNIDPQLPTQPTYYTNDWEYLLLGSVEDRLVFNDLDTKIIMVRKSFRRTGKQFQANLSNNQSVIIDESETEWDIFNGDLKKVGNYTLKRRFCNQNDFNLSPNEVMLISFNELYYICLPLQMGGWGIDVASLNENFKVYVKQLRSPMTRDMVINMHMATLLNNIDLGYIGLGSCIN